MYTNDRNAYRQAFINAWKKSQQQKPLDALERQIVAAVKLHPEYHVLLDQSALDKQEFTLEENPFVHLSLHVALFEQLHLNKPEGIREIFINAKEKYSDEHMALHQMMKIMTELLAEGTKSGKMPDDQAYMMKLKENF